MADPVGMLASCVAVAGLATTVVKILDDFIARWDAALLSLEGLKSIVLTFTNSLCILASWMEQQYLESGAAADLTYVRYLATSCEGCMRFLIALKIELDLLGPIPKSRWLSWGRKATILWNEKRIKDLQDHLMSQNQGLMLLLECRNLSQREGLMSKPQNQKIMNEVQNDTTILRQEKPSGLVNTAEKSAVLSGGASTQAVKVRDNLAPYSQYLSFFSQVKALNESNFDTLQSAPEMAVLPEAKQIREEYHNIVSKDSDFLVPECPRLRVLIIGQQGIGKSTICSKVLGISPEQAGVSNRGIGTAASKVWDEITGPQNQHLILHDSGGFRPNRSEEFEQIKSFIEYRRKQKLLKDQLHCIWYCISSVGSRSLQDGDGIEGDFFKLDTGQIPVFVIFTKFDLLIREHRDKLEEEDPAMSQRTPQQRMFAAEEPAFNDYRDNMESKILTLSRGKPHVKICRVAIPESKGERKEYKLPEYRLGEIVGLTPLIKEVAKDLEGDGPGDGNRRGLSFVWVAGQRYNADMKLKASIQDCIDQYWRVRRVTKIPIVPILCLWTLGQAYSEIMRRLSQCWGLVTEPSDLLISEDNLYFGFLEATYDAPTGSLVLNSTMLASFNFGPLLGSRVVKIILKMITGLTLIFERLFLIQQKQGENPTPLTKEAIGKEAVKFQNSPERRMMNDAIESRIFLGNCYQMSAAKEAASKAIRAGKSKSGQKFSTLESMA